MNIYKIIGVLTNPKKLMLYLSYYGFLNWMPDKMYLKMMYRLRMGKKLNLINPITYNEKLQWLKLYDRKDSYRQLVDKYEVRQYISKTIGEEYLFELLGVWDSFEDIDFNKLPNEFVLKCTHDSGGLVICKDKSKFDITKAKNKINKCLKRNYYYSGREWVYKYIKPRIICEKYMVDESGTELKDYKFFCFDGEPKALFIATDRGIDTRFDFFDLDFNHLPFMQHYKNGVKEIKKPAGFDEMLELSRELSKGFPHVRVDFYDINGKVYFGEFTFFHFGGMEKFEPEKYDKIFGDYINIPISVQK